MPSHETLVRGFPRHRYTVALEHILPLSVPEHGIGVLDVGGFKNNQILQDLLPGVSVVSLNIPNELHGRKGDIYYNGQRIPLQMESIPISLAVDILEHVQSNLRLTLLQEMARVSKQKIVISGPFHSEANVEHEENLLNAMKEYGLSPKASIAEHRLLGLPKLDELVFMARLIGFPFYLIPATNASTDFLGLLSQAEVFTNSPFDQAMPKAKSLADLTEKVLADSQNPTWQEAYRASLVLDKGQEGRIVSENEISFSHNERTAYQAALSVTGYRYVENPIAFYPENPLRGRNIAIEGPEGSGKTSIMRAVTEALRQWGYTLAVTTDHGMRQMIRDTEKIYGRLIPEPQRGQLFASAMIEATIAGNAHTLRGPCFVTLNDRCLASVPMHHALHCPDDPIIPALLRENAPQIPPDLTIILRIEDPSLNWERLRQDQDLANMERTQEQLAYQRDYYAGLKENKLTGKIARVSNPGVGGIERVVEEVLGVITKECGIPTKRPQNY